MRSRRDWTWDRGPYLSRNWRKSIDAPFLYDIPTSFDLPAFGRFAEENSQ